MGDRPTRSRVPWLPSENPVRFLPRTGEAASGKWFSGNENGEYSLPDPELLRTAYRKMVVGRRFDAQATALARQGRLAVHPSSLGQEACQIGAALALRPTDWLFPTYRDCVALVSRGIDPVEALTLLRGDAHCGYDPVTHRTAPQCTPLATHTAHAAGLAHGERLKGTDTVALALLGDGATSEGDFHEALGLAGVLKAPVVFLVQNNGYAISVPFAAQSAAPALAYKGVGYGVRSEQVDGNDAVALIAVLHKAVESARAGDGPWLIEAHTYRMAAHTSADDPSRYRSAEEAEAWRDRDPVERLESWLMERQFLTSAEVMEIAAEAEAYAAGVRVRLAEDPAVDPRGLVDHVFSTPTPQLTEQCAALEGC
ncbi:thiamine pyrophosphate-dependent enzyme [Streptomyces acidiscabies]|uniref:2-oxoisovalerate dehydrogenase subunit alpha n=2 Tax=Streptomyces acidiscabies TaxID=42234 RepID=A0AAP6BJV4_9ACTN|nr:thiamine pyrophosphate-dependent enzyme [Streptomyces acidiscabies]MBP5936768.1 pyruvate dehydrogenase (acetyl-transferring) E1 component subunit alpha [Streptomyces sp. LBUM 1476]MBZ3915225.1 pyruvate dehydrogenase (acetyl-transferring) E1 component subunit alpha [Streptomyces acidiscabies]MDX2966084.1 thiamine pyrophosphate-dependent enzyme [Streptomyces acidiscabies]MDX3793460.1 thiamine pyrophosphate-dependent enzyme [Streptomyces acidiscabies]GAQ54822.1 3-methyl-2-oxobutanoate dehydrog